MHFFQRNAYALGQLAFRVWYGVCGFEDGNSGLRVLHPGDEEAKFIRNFREFKFFRAVNNITGCLLIFARKLILCGKNGSSFNHLFLTLWIFCFIPRRYNIFDSIPTKNKKTCSSLEYFWNLEYPMREVFLHVLIEILFFGTPWIIKIDYFSSIYVLFYRWIFDMGMKQ